MRITQIEGSDLAALVRVLNERSKAGKLRTLRISQGSDNQVIYKVNEGTWSPPVGVDGRS